MPYLSIQEASEELRSGLIAPTELLAETLERIDQLDSKIHAFITVMRDQAFAEAEQADNARRTGLVLGPLHGTPSGGNELHAVTSVHLTPRSETLSPHIT